MWYLSRTFKRSLENVIKSSPFVTSVRKVTETVNLQTSGSFLWSAGYCLLLSLDSNYLKAAAVRL